MSIPLGRLGGHSNNHHDSDEVEAEYDRLRDLARDEAKKRNSCFERSRQAYSDGDGALAKRLSEEGKKHDAAMDEYNKQASEYIFRANNSPDRVEPDCIDLHGQFAEEAEEILAKRIRADIAAGQTVLHAIVGKGIHSENHVQKIKPKVEALCREMGLSYETGANAGRIDIDLTGGRQHARPERPDHGGRPSHRPRPPPQQEEDRPHDPAADLVTKIIRKIEHACCIVM